MRATRPHPAEVQPGRARHIAAARVAVWLSAAALGIAMGFNVGLPLPHPERAPRGQAQSNQAEVAVLLFPDLEGAGDHAPDCIGCDGEFGSGDLLFAERDPLPRLDVMLTDDAGTSLTMRTRTLAPGRQQTLFRIDQPGAYTVTLSALPTEWHVCPSAPLPLRLTADDFDPATRRAEVSIALSHGCQRAEPTGTAPDAPTAGPTGAAGATDAPPATATDATDRDGDTPAGGSAAATATGDDAPRAAADAPGAPDAPAGGDAFGTAAALASAAPLLPHTGQAGGSHGRVAGWAALALVAALLGAGGRRLQRAPFQRSAGQRPPRPS